MSKYDTIKEKILAKPSRTDVTPNDLMHFLEKSGFVVKRIKGSHYIYKHPDAEKLFVVPMHDPIKPIYLDQLKDIIEIIEEK